MRKLSLCYAIGLHGLCRMAATHFGLKLVSKWYFQPFVATEFFYLALFLDR
ncbi:hypothetical protein ALO85_200062 [Pseudomonas syringae pv. aptata]|nr:hypothetical protein ALO85_200062 [Pseudomonas syringae pv. aptata]